jgi:hypothetical protein
VAPGEHFEPTAGEPGMRRTRTHDIPDQDSSVGLSRGLPLPRVLSSRARLLRPLILTTESSLDNSRKVYLYAGSNWGP